jgi:photoactive yellow protein
MDLAFSEAGLLDELRGASSGQIDALPFGVVGMSSDGVVTCYNAFESRLAGLEPATVIGRHFFSQVAPCTNNYLVAKRFETEATIDDTINYVFTLRMQPTKVRLRLLKTTGHGQMFLCVERR